MPPPSTTPDLISSLAPPSHIHLISSMRQYVAFPSFKWILQVIHILVLCHHIKLPPFHLKPLTMVQELAPLQPPNLYHVLYVPDPTQHHILKSKAKEELSWCHFYLSNNELRLIQPLVKKWYYPTYQRQMTTA